jgi:hypothetical protein
MADPISVFPEFVRNQVYPPTPTAPVVGPITATVSDPGLTVTVTEETIVVTIEPEELDAGV